MFRIFILGYVHCNVRVRAERLYPFKKWDKKKVRRYCVTSQLITRHRYRQIPIRLLLVYILPIGKRIIIFVFKYVRSNT